MEKTVVGLLGVAFRMLLRYWTKDRDILRENIVDVQEFAQQCGLSIWEAKRFNRTLDEFIDIIAENFIKEFGGQIEEEKRKKQFFDKFRRILKKLLLVIFN